MSDNFTLCAHSAHENLLVFVTRLLAASQTQRADTVAEAAARDPELAAALTTDFDWPGIFGFDVPASATPPPAPETPGHKSRCPPETAATTPAKRPRFRRAGDTAVSGATTSKAALAAAAAQTRLDTDGTVGAAVTADAAAPAATVASNAPETPLAPSVDRTVFGSLLKRRKFDKPVYAGAAAPSVPKAEVAPAPQAPSTQPPVGENVPQGTPEGAATLPPVPPPAPPPRPAVPPSPGPPPAAPAAPAPPPPPPPPPECDACGCHGHTADNCDAFPEARVAHQDALLRAAAPLLHGRLDVRREDDLVIINDVRFLEGYASGAGCNCLIDTLRQHLGLTANVVPVIRERLRMLFQLEPNIVTEGNYLDFLAHTRAIMRMLSNIARRGGDPIDTSVFRIVCIDLDRVDHGGAVVGEGDVTLYIGCENGNHFIPLHELRVQAD